MSMTVSANDAKNRFGSLLAHVNDAGGGDVIVERHGHPRAVLISYAAYEEVQSLRQDKRRAAAREMLRQIQAQAEILNHDLTEEESIALAEEISQAALQSMIDRGEVRFERDRLERSDRS